jgi:hypothetical protein
MTKNIIGELLIFIIGLYIIIEVIRSLNFDYGSLLLGGIVVLFFIFLIRGRIRI